ncbi:MAG TPA: V4R domain-containing protein [Opitutaceae bacterium]|nr:V4R domain-containing protein [Opitutaceae bacterium]
MSSRTDSDGSKPTAELPPAEGFARSLQSGGGLPVAVATIEFVRSLHFTLLETFGDDTQDVLYRLGYEWGLREMTALHSRLREKSGKPGELWQMEVKTVLEAWWAPLLAGGWGAWTLTSTSKARGISAVEMRNSIVAAALPGADFPVCHLYAGLFAGGLSFLERAERHGVEITCRAVGDAACTFIIAPAGDVDPVETWRQQGVAAPEIIGRLR